MKQVSKANCTKHQVPCLVAKSVEFELAVRERLVCEQVAFERFAFQQGLRECVEEAKGSRRRQEKAGVGISTQTWGEITIAV